MSVTDKPQTIARFLMRVDIIMVKQPKYTRY